MTDLTELQQEANDLVDQALRTLKYIMRVGDIDRKLAAIGILYDFISLGVVDA